MNVFFSASWWFHFVYLFNVSCRSLFIFLIFALKSLFLSLLFPPFWNECQPQEETLNILSSPVLFWAYAMGSFTLIILLSVISFKWKIKIFPLKFHYRVESICFILPMYTKLSGRHMDPFKTLKNMYEFRSCTFKSAQMLKPKQPLFWKKKNYHTISGELVLSGIYPKYRIFGITWIRDIS